MASSVRCGICLVFASSIEHDHFVITQCGHVYHFGCIQRWAAFEKYPPSCPVCREPVPVKTLIKLHGVSPVECQGGSNSKYNIKVVLLGDSGTGKSSLLQAFDKGSHLSAKDATVGCDVCFKSLEVAGKPIKLTVWDCGGQDRFRAITPNYLRSTNGVCLVYDITKPESLDSVNEWLELIYEHGPTDVSIMLIGNKTDLEDNRSVPTAAGQDVASQLGFNFIETSAKDQVNVEAAFRTLVASVLEGFWKNGHIDSIEGGKFTLESTNSKPSSGCWC